MPQNALVATPESRPKRRAVEVAFGALVGLVFACLNGPWLLSLLYRPISSSAVSCGPDVTDALAYFVRLQLISGAVGGVLLLTLSFLIRRALRRRRASRALPTT